LIIEAFRNIKRVDFVSADLKEDVGVDAPLSIGFGQTISQPLTVAFMLELLQPEPGNKILDIGSGSGWTTALLAWCVANGVIVRSETTKQSRGSITGSPRPLGARDDNKSGKVFAIERVPELCEFGKNNILKYNFISKGIVETFCVDGSQGLPGEAPFNRILVSAAAEAMPLELKQQLAIKGRLVIPIKNSIWLVERQSQDKFLEQEFYGFSFVPLVSKQ